ncbi:hypothetical protein CMI37_38090 [Candidatus Pacearchaeota archaeon]|nr:hypothetical protein [Candidatus Pacearchaeota archaeon]
MMKNKELIMIDVVGVALTILIVAVCSLLVSGCASNKQETEYDLLYREPPSVAYKSPTIKDYKDDDDMCES